MAQSAYVYDVPPPRRAFYEDNPRMVFSNWLYDQGGPPAQAEWMKNLYDQLYGDYYRKLALDPVNSGWFGDYLYGQTPEQLNKLAANYSYEARGYDPRRYIGKVRWVGV